MVAAYKSTLCRLLSYLDKPTVYHKDHEFTTDRLARLKPADIMRWFNYETFGTEEPNEAAHPKIRSASLKYWKKALSHFMPNRMMVWNELADMGNPTRYVY